MFTKKEFLQHGLTALIGLVILTSIIVVFATYGEFILLGLAGIALIIATLIVCFMLGSFIRILLDI